MLTLDSFKSLENGEINKKEFLKLVKSDISPVKLEEILRDLNYQEQLFKLQAELVNLQKWVTKNKKRVCIIFEGRDAAGKGGSIRRMTEHLNPRARRVVALSKPTEVEQGQWYFRRYIKEMPNPGELVFFDRSWYNRAILEPVNGFCSDQEYDIFMNQVNDFERMITESGVRLIKFYFSISKSEQEKRFQDIIDSPIKKWKFSALDKKALELWDDYTDYKDKMFSKTNTIIAPWKVIKANRKTKARIEAIEHVLISIPYDDKDLKVLKHVYLDD